MALGFCLSFYGEEPARNFMVTLIHDFVSKMNHLYEVKDLSSKCQIMCIDIVYNTQSLSQFRESQ